MAVFETVAVAVWAMLPAYVPNSAAVVGGGGRPIDGGRTWRGKRILGDGKSWRGTAVGTAAGAALALALNVLSGAVGGAVGVDLPRFPWQAVVALPLGAMLGDMTASFLKRRTGRERGAAFPGVDQLDFVVGALVVGFALGAVTGTDWFVETFTLGVLAVIVVVTPVIHVGTNVIAYVTGLKDEPW